MKTKHFILKDYSFSKEEFYLVENSKFGYLETHPKPTNLKKYYQSENYISHTDRSRGVFEKLYQFVKKITLIKKIKLIKKFNPSGKLLDIGAGTGDFLQIAKKNHFEIFGIEPEEKARNKAKNKGIFLEKSTENFLEKFDIITMWHSLEHISNLNEHIIFLKKHLKENGTLIIALPNYKSKDAYYYKNFWAGYDVPRHLWHFSKTSVEKLFSENEFKIIKTKPMLFDSFYVSMLSEKYKYGKINIIKGFFIGLYSNLHAIKTKEFSSIIYILKHN